MATLAPVTTLQVLRRAARSLVRGVMITASVACAAVGTATVAVATNGYEEATQPGVGLTVVQTLLLYVAAPGVLFALIALVVVGPSLGKGPRHRTGTALATGPVWIDGAGGQHRPAETVTPGWQGASDQGGASAHW